MVEESSALVEIEEIPLTKLKAKIDVGRFKEKYLLIWDTQSNAGAYFKYAQHLHMTGEDYKDAEEEDWNYMKKEDI